MASWLEPTLLFSFYLLFFSVFSSASGIGVATAFIAVFGLFYLKKRVARIFELPVWWPFLFFALAVVLSVMLSDAPGAHFSKAVLKLRYFLVAFVMAVCLAASPTWRRQIGRAAFPMAVLLGSLAVFQFFGCFHPPAFLHLTSVGLAVIPQSNGHFFHARGLLYHHNPFAFGMLLLFYLNLGQALCTSESGWRRAFWIGTMFCLVALLASCSRGAWVALIFSGLSLSLFLGRKFWRGFAAACLVAIVLASALGGAVDKRFEAMVPEKNQERLRLWSISWQLFLTSPVVGHGYHESFETKRVPYMTPGELRSQTFPTDPHSVYFDLLGTTGLVGFLTFLVFLGSVLRSYFLALRSAGLSEEDRGILLAAWGAFVCFIWGAAFDSHLYHTETLCVMLYGLALGQATVLCVRRREESASPLSSWSGPLSLTDPSPAPTS